MLVARALFYPSEAFIVVGITAGFPSVTSNSGVSMGLGES